MIVKESLEDDDVRLLEMYWAVPAESQSSILNAVSIRACVHLLYNDSDFQAQRLKSSSETDFTRRVLLKCRPAYPGTWLWPHPVEIPSQDQLLMQVVEEDPIDLVLGASAEDEAKAEWLSASFNNSREYVARGWELVEVIYLKSREGYEWVDLNWARGYIVRWRDSFEQLLLAKSASIRKDE